MELPEDLQAEIFKALDPSDKRGLACTFTEMRDELMTDDHKAYMEKEWSKSNLTKREVYMRWLKGEAALEKGRYKCVFIKVRRER